MKCSDFTFSINALTFWIRCWYTICLSCQISLSQGVTTVECQLMRIIRMEKKRKANSLAPSTMLCSLSNDWSGRCRIESAFSTIYCSLTSVTFLPFNIQIQLNQLVSMEFELNRMTIGVSWQAALFNFFFRNQIELRLPIICGYYFAVRQRLLYTMRYNLARTSYTWATLHCALNDSMIRQTTVACTMNVEWFTSDTLAKNRKNQTNPMTIQSHPTAFYQ